VVTTPLAPPVAISARAFPAAQAEPSPPAAQDGGAPLPNRITRAANARIALVLPLESTSYGRAADAVKAGFLAAADAAQEKTLVIGHADGGVVEAFAKAIAGGAGIIVGPLVRDDLKTIAGLSVELPWTLALNQLEEGASLPRRMYTLTLAIESDARQLARAARDHDAQTIGIITGDAPLQKRFASAFTAEWILLGGGPPAFLHFERTPEMLAVLKRELGRIPLDAALLALDAGDVALVKPYIGQIPAYTSGQVNDRQSREILRDLDDVRFVEIPWLADPGAPAFEKLPRGDFRNASLDRLYALGIDAFRVAQAFRDGPPSRLEFDGATGRVSLDGSNQFVRDGRLMRFDAGQIVPANGQ